MKSVIIHIDNNLIVADKPTGMLCASDRSGTPGLREHLQEKYGEVFLTHRIDRDTSGLMAFARNELAHKTLSTAFLNRDIDKYYTALVLGSPKTGLLDYPLKTIKMGSHYKSIVDKNGKQSISDIIRVEQYGPYAKIEIKLITGRMHQIRAHCANANHPLIGDPFYGGPEQFLLSQIKRRYNNKETERPLIKRVALHAHQLSLNLSSLNINSPFNSSLPKDIKAVTNQLKKNFS